MQERLDPAAGPVHAAALRRMIAYARVSTREQFDRGASLDVQAAAIRDYAAAHGFQVVAELREDISGATAIEERPAGGQAFAMLRRGEADAICVHVFDRLVRPPESGDEWDVPPLIRDLARLGCEIHTTDTGPIRNDFAGLLIVAVKAMQAGQERRDITRRTLAGKRHRAAAGHVVCDGSPPYGYARQVQALERRTVLVIDAEAAAIVRWIFEEYVRRDGPSLGKLVAALNARGATVPCLRQGRQSSGKWSRTTVANILHNRAYIGEFRSHGAIVMAPDLALVEREVFLRAQARLDENRRDARRNATHLYLLAGGRLRCPCGRSMFGFMARGHPAYRCGNTDRHGHTPRVLYAERVEAAVWAWLRDTLLCPERLAAAQADARTAREARTAPLEARAAQIDAQIERETGNVRRLMRQFGAGDDDAAALIEEARRARGALQGERERVQAEIDAAALAAAGDAEARSLAVRIHDQLEAATREDDREWQQWLIRYVDLVATYHLEQVGGAEGDAAGGAGGSAGAGGVTRRWLDIESQVGHGRVVIDWPYHSRSNA